MTFLTGWLTTLLPDYSKDTFPLVRFAFVSQV